MKFFMNEKMNKVHSSEGIEFIFIHLSVRTPNLTFLTLTMSSGTFLKT